MKKGNVDTLLRSPVAFLSDVKSEGDVAISSRVRLARNLHGYRFPAAADGRERAEVVAEVGKALEESAALRKDFLCFLPPEMSELDQEVLFERRLVSRDLLSREGGTALFTRRDEGCSVMVNEEDHLRIQVMRSGFQVEEVWDIIDRFDDKLGGFLEYAYDPQWGYLTSCPTNLGTGMRISVMLHLPGMVLSGGIGQLVQSMGKLNFAVRGIYGEGTGNRGNLFQISNQSTLGESEIAIAEKLHGVIRQIVASEEHTRERLFSGSEKNKILDVIGRAEGILRYACKLSAEEALNHLSMLRLGVDFSCVKGVTPHLINDIFIALNPAHLRKTLPPDFPLSLLDVERASMIKAKLNAKDDRN